MSHPDSDIRRMMRAIRYLKRAQTELERMKVKRTECVLQEQPLRHVILGIERDTSQALREFSKNA